MPSSHPSSRAASPSRSQGSDVAAGALLGLLEAADAAGGPAAGRGRGAGGKALVGAGADGVVLVRGDGEVPKHRAITDAIDVDDDVRFLIAKQNRAEAGRKSEKAEAGAGAGPGPGAGGAGIGGLDALVAAAGLGSPPPTPSGRPPADGTVGAASPSGFATVVGETRVACKVGRGQWVG